MRSLACAFVVLVLALVAATADERAPRRLSATGLYADGSTTVLAEGVRPFSPQYPLWSDGASKHRWVSLPPGSVINASSPTAWEMPIGTRLWKEFQFHGRKVETRFIWRASRDRWVFASYVWNADGTEAELASADGVPGAAQIAPNRFHAIPSVNDCVACHGAKPTQPLGFNALQLSPDRDPAAIHAEPLAPGMVTLETLVAEGRLQGHPAQAAAPRIATNDPATRAMLGYLLANCGSCHNGKGEIAAMGPILRIDELLRNGDAVARGLLGQRTRWQVPGVPDGESVVADPHALDRSALLVRMRSRRPSSQMPPLGTVLRDDEAVARITQWLEGQR